MKILAVASIGGHWVQLLHLIPPSDSTREVVYLSTHPKCISMVSGRAYYTMKDFSRWDFYRLFPAFIRAIRIVAKEKPDTVVSTGAAPGIITLLAARLLGRKTVWIDSVANVQGLSLSGRLASTFVTQTYTQWKHLAGKNIKYVGNVLDSI
jgi:UDP-N-acetylglucosamine:LPS N-acetylglucosamine transferase